MTYQKRQRKFNSNQPFESDRRSVRRGWYSAGEPMRVVSIEKDPKTGKYRKVLKEKQYPEPPVAPEETASRKARRNWYKKTGFKITGTNQPNKNEKN